jgi:hypothetical protein
VYVPPEKYTRLPDAVAKAEVARVIGRLNKRLEGDRFILMGPGRWGSTNIDLGVKVTYADIYNASVLIEIAVDEGAGAPEASYGTHFFRDLVEAAIFPLALYPDDEGTIFNWSFFGESPNALGTLLPADAQHSDRIKVIDVPAVSGGRFLDIIMDGKLEQALGYLALHPTGP